MKWFFVVSACGCFLLHWGAFAQSLSSSKLSAHFINSYTVGGSEIVAGRPQTLKVLGLDSGFPSGMVQSMRDYRAHAPGGKIVVRIYSPKTYSLANDATASASDFWTTVLQPGLNSLTALDRALIDFLEGPNEGQTPTLGYPGSAPLQASRWFNQFWTNLTPRIVTAGYKPCIGSIAVGNPAGTVSEMQSYLAAFVPALRQAKAAGGAWSYHAYTVNYTTDPGTEIWYSLRYRQFYSYFATAYPDLNTIPLILTEGGVDQSGDPSLSGWQARGSAADYQRWLNWFDGQIRQDAYVLGCTLFEIGNPESWGWPSFDLEPIAGWMGNYLGAPTSVPPAPTGVQARAVPGSITVSWTNPPLNPTTWTVKRSTTAGGPYSPIAANITGGVQATSYQDTGVINAVTYYYVVSALNAVGESPNSTQVSARLTNALPDVMVTAVNWTPASLFTGSRAVFSARVLNQGSAPTPAGTILGVGFNVDGAGTASWSASYTAALAPNASVTLVADGGPTGNYWTATPGPHTVVATVDDINRFPESNENNNSLSVPFTVYVTGYALNSGGPAVGAFAADAKFAGSANTLSATNAIDVSAAANPAPAAVYQTARWGDFAYVLNNLVPGSNYTLRLHFAEISTAVNSAGERRFNVAVNGARVLTDFDVWAEAGAKFRAVTRQVRKAADGTGTLLVDFSHGSANDPICSGIELYGAAPAAPPIITAITVTNGTATLSWQSAPGGIYQLQYKNVIGEGAWTTLGDLFLADGATSSVALAAAAPQGFYRLSLVN